MRKEQLVGRAKAQAKWRKANPERARRNVRNSHYKNRYGLTLDHLDWLYLAQGGKCLVCGKDLDRDINVDHCHETGAIRGLLHRRCNSLLGHAKDDPAVLRRAVEYLEAQ